MSDRRDLSGSPAYDQGSLIWLRFVDLDLGGEPLNEITPTKTESLTLQAAPPCCDGANECDGKTRLRLGASFTPGDLALLSFSIPADQWKDPLDDREAAKSVRVWYVVAAADGEGENRVLTGILSGEAKHVLGSRIHKDTLDQMEPIKFTPRSVRGGILHRETIKKRRARRNARKDDTGKQGVSDTQTR